MALNGVQSVDRALDLLETLAAASRDLGITELGEAAQLPISTTHRLLDTLARRGYARQDPDTRRYSIGPHLVVLSSRARRLFGTWVRPFLAELVELTGETADLAVLEDGWVVYLDEVPSPNKVRLTTDPGQRSLPHATALGKALLAGRPRDEVEAVIVQHGLPRLTAKTIIDHARFIAELDEVLRRGFACDDEEQELGVRCIAVPVLQDNATIAALSVTGPTGRLRVEPNTDTTQRMQHIAANLSAFLAGARDGRR